MLGICHTQAMNPPTDTTHHVYVLRSLKDGKLYTGSTSNLKRRLQQHNSGMTASLRWRRPLELIYSEKYTTRVEAETREKYLKTGKGREELKGILLASSSKPMQGSAGNPPISYGGQEW